MNPVGFFTAGAGTRTHHLQVADDVMLLADGATSWRCSPTTTCAVISKITSPTALRIAKKMEIAFLEMPGFGINRLW